MVANMNSEDWANFLLIGLFNIGTLWGIYGWLELHETYPATFWLGFSIPCCWIIYVGLGGAFKKDREKHQGPWAGIAHIIFVFCLGFTISSWAGAFLSLSLNATRTDDCPAYIPTRYC